MATPATTTNPGRGGDDTYYDFLLLGRTGMGKSTLGNKLLQWEKTDQSKLEQITSSAVQGLLKAASGVKRFLTANDVRPPSDSASAVPASVVESVTTQCELLANDVIKTRVLDVPGFADSGALSRIFGIPLSAYEVNLQLLRNIVRVQAETGLRVRRVVYFLPIRGALEKAEATIQEELQVMHHFFGQDIFNCMVVVATTHPRKKYQALGFDEEDMQETRAVFHATLKKVDERIDCPPIVYIGVDDSDKKVSNDLRTALVLEDKPLILKFTDDVCSRCSVKIRKLDRQKKEVLGVVDDEDLISYDESKCHICFVQRYTTGQKIIGGMAHIACGGVALIVEKVTSIKTWPGFTNSEEMCPHCKHSPGSKGCLKVKTTHNYKDCRPDSDKILTVLVDHESKL